LLRRSSIWAEPQRNQRQGAELSVISDVLIALKALQRVHRIGAPGTVNRAVKIAAIRESLLDFFIPIRCRLRLSHWPRLSYGLSTFAFLAGCPLLGGLRAGFCRSLPLAGLSRRCCKSN